MRGCGGEDIATGNIAGGGEPFTREWHVGGQTHIQAVLLQERAVDAEAVEV